MPEATHDPTCARDLVRGNPIDSWPVAIFGIPFFNGPANAAIERIDAMIAHRRRGCVLAANMAFVLRARRDAELQRVANDADLVLCDSQRLVWASRWLGNPLPCPIRAAPFVRALIALVAARRLRLFLVGSRSDATSALAAGLQHIAPGITIAGTFSPALCDATDRDGLLRLVGEASADLVLGCLDAVDQQKWLAAIANHCTAPVVITAAAGQPVETPASNFRPEWPESLERLLHCGRAAARTTFEFASALLRERAVIATTGDAWPAQPAISSATDDWMHVEAGTDLTRPAIERHADCWRSATSSRHCAIDVSHVQRIDATGLALLAQHRTRRRRDDCELVLIAPTTVVATALAAAHLAPLFPVAATLDEAHQFVAARRPPSPQQDGMTRSLAWCGEIIAANVDDVWQMTSGYVRTFAASGATLVMIDLTRLRFIDGAGAALMLRVKKSAREWRAEVIFTHPQSIVVDVLRLAKIDALLLEGGQ